MAEARVEDSYNAKVFVIPTVLVRWTPIDLIALDPAVVRGSLGI